MFDFGNDVRGEPVTMAAPVEPGLDGRAILRRLRQGFGFIVLTALFMVAVAVAALTMLAPRYASGIQILVDPADLRVLDNDISNRTPQADSGVSLAESQVRVIQSDNVLLRVVRKLDLASDDEFLRPPSTSPLVNSVKQVLGMEPPPGGSDPVNIALDSLRLKTTVRRPERTFVIDVIVETQEPEKSARIANAMGDAFFAEEAAARTDIARRASESLTGRLAALRQAVEEAERKVVRYRQDNKLVSTSGRLLSDQQLGDLNQQLVTASIRTAEARERLDQAKRMRAGEAGTALPEMLQSTEMQNLRQQYATLSRTTAELATRLGERHPAMAEQYAQQRDLQRLIQREKERIIDTSKKDYDRSAASEAAIRKSLEGAKAETAANDRANVGLRELERELDARKAVYETFLRRSRETNEQERLNNANVRIISSATPARVRSWPPSPKVVLPLALGVGVLLGALIALFLGAGRDRKRREPDVVIPGRSFRAVDA
ncbi:GumC family protein [Methylobacterium sp. Leaf108]|uniref:GumC family protein n=1 Tax=Methylobacterium sp. Leaf108 TaxID=1736256 RepID=UPI0006FDA544|nr:GumC family protein [Methylobacterium sp. Leaf108]KQP54974.1 lipopolysaccharide biosynthesis protein [Methylobacterium sp. Leaf108]